MIIYLIGLVLVIGLSAIAIKPIVKKRKYNRKQLAIAKAYDQLVRKFKLAIDYSEFLCYRYIGLDRRNKKLVLIDHSGNEKQELCFSLLEIGESKIITVKDELQGIKAVILELRNKRNNKSVRFCFYHKEYDDHIKLTSLSRKAIHWKTKVDIHKHRGNLNFEADYIL